MSKIAIFPLAKLGPLGLLGIVAALSAVYVCHRGDWPMHWAAIGLLPLLAYLGNCHFRARKMILAEQGRERDIIKHGFIAMVADRSARFWGVLFSLVVVATCVTTTVIWAYQAWLWYRAGTWISITGLSVVGVVPHTGHAHLQQMLYWLADTNMGVLVLITGLIAAAPIAAISWRANNKAKFRRNDLANLKRRS